MRLPAALEHGIEDQLSAFDRKGLARAVEELSRSYRNPSASGGLSTGFINNDLQRAAYLLTRLPATYAAIHAVLREVKERMPGVEVRSLLDLGAGPGTAMWAAAEIFSELEQIMLIEQSNGFIRLGQKFAASAPSAAIQTSRWGEADLKHETQLPEHDLIVISYALGELPSTSRSRLLLSAWRAAAKVIAVIEPGTPRGFEVILHVRDELLQKKAHLIAPCPHEKQCPMSLCGTAVPGCVSPASKIKQDWCHFAQRLERTSLHRKLKAGELGYEDEKFSYIAASRQSVPLAEARVVRHPIQLKGHIKLELCTREGLKQETVTRSQGGVFKIARKAKWGEEWAPDRDSPPNTLEF
ncbi:MAG TPA: small ribosomal subunit Rsm22 family protein [Terriglobales bacterium]|jgi:ribosomal protein RSM22 (predicted rRNA methylase)|nr:small ribosomal subunit Rsm22 family protein [Terriglobales bacterium]